MLGGVPDLVVGAALGAVVSAAYNDLYDLAKQAVAAATWCKKYCRELAADLELLRPLLHDICSAMQVNPQLPAPFRPQLLEFKDRLEDGKTLVGECRRVNRFDFFRRHRFGKSILNLEKDITSFIQKLSAVNTQMLCQLQIRSLQHTDRLEEVARTQRHFSQRHEQVARDQVELSHEHNLHLQQLSQQQNDRFAELDKKQKLRSDELQETVRLVVEKMTETDASSSAIAVSLQQLGATLALNDTSSDVADRTSRVQDTFTLPQLVVGMDRPLMEVKEQLLANQQSVMLVGVKGMGGIGKTTLALALCRDAEIEAFFEGRIHFLTVSQSPNMLELYKKLWGKLVDGAPPWFQNEEDAQRQLQGAIRRMESPVLLVLDDVWSRAHLEKLDFEGKQCRILFTTRQVSTLPVRNTYLYQLGLLCEEDAHRLFCFWAFRQESIPDWAHAFPVKEVQDECKCLPLALKVIGGSLFGQPMVAWKNAKKRLRQAQTIGDYHTDALLKCLQTSFDVLDVQLQQCFIDFGAFPEDKDLPVHILHDIWISVRGMEWDDAVMALAELSSRCLVDVFSIILGLRPNALAYGSAQEMVCRQHDVMRDLALYLGRRASVPNPRSLEINHEDLQPDVRKWLLMPHREQRIPQDWQSYSTKGHFSAEIVSINTGAVAKEDWPYGMNFSATQALLLYTDADSYTLPPFVESMSELKVFSVRSSRSACNYTGFEAINGLTDLRSIELHMLSNDAMPECFRALKKLQKLYLSFCRNMRTMNDFALNISSGPNLTNFIGQSSRNLNDLMDELGVLPSLRRLYSGGCPILRKLPDEFGQNLSNLVLLSLKHCRGLQALPDSLCNLQQLELLDISFCGKIKSLPKDLGQLSNLKELNLRCCKSLKVLPSSITQLGSLEGLLMAGCAGLESLPEDLGKLRKLRILELLDCRSLQTLPSSILELRALERVSFDDKWAGQWEAMKDHMVGSALVLRAIPSDHFWKGDPKLDSEG